MGPDRRGPELLFHVFIDGKYEEQRGRAFDESFGGLHS